MPERASASGVSWRVKVEALFGVDVRSLALFRCAVGIVLLVDLLERWRWLRENYTDLGVLPRWLLAARPTAFFPSAHTLGGSVTFEALLFGLAGVFAFMLLVGYRTRLAQIASWYLLVSLQVRNPLLMHAGDHLLALVLFWSLFLPLGAVASLDARARAPAARRIVLSPASAALLLQFAFVYVFAGLNKTGPEWNGEGSAIYHALSQSYVSRPLGEMLLSYPGLLRVLTPAVRVFEVAGPLLLFSPVATGPLRCLMIPVFWIFQHSLGLTLDLGVFPWICSVAILPFVPTWFWNRVGRLRGAEALPAGIPPPPVLATAAAAARLSWLGSGLVAVLLAMAAFSNLESLSLRLALKRPLRDVVSVPRLLQSWTMYGRPAPYRYDYWFRREGWISDGRRLDLDRDGSGPRWERVREIHRNYRFKMYVERVGREDDSWRHSYARWLCREFNAGLPGDAKLRVVELIRHEAEVRAPLRPGAPPVRLSRAEPRIVVSGPCPTLGVSAERSR